MEKIQLLFRDPYSILYLLPYSGQTRLVNKHQKLDDLYFIKSVVDFSILALEDFLEGKLEKFDAQVGENLCQIRAYKILNLEKKWLSNQTSKAEFFLTLTSVMNYKHTIENIIHEWENLIKHSAHYIRNLDSPEYILPFLERHGLSLNLNEDCIFIIACYFLTHFSIRDNNLPIAINIDYISREFHISKYRAKRLTHKYQLVVCKLGCDFILDIAKDFPEKYDYAQILPSLLKVSDENRLVMPCFIVTDSILAHCSITKTPILIITRRKVNIDAPLREIIYFLIRSTDIQSSYELVPLTPHLEQNCMVVIGDTLMSHSKAEESTSEYIHRFLKSDPIKMILTNTANHPQYSGNKLAALRHNPFQEMPLKIDRNIISKHVNFLTALKQFAQERGCSKENQSIFFLRHIYASCVSSIIQQLQGNYGDTIYDAYEIINQKTRNYYGEENKPSKPVRALQAAV